ncbi:hypothetical protein M4R22_22025 [Acidovorax sp. GBBC 3334]|uniref:hypothetical protein n=1 Tax=Acidovorax sp. GBBC 3334 TaxID=2940496 RepID=UPI002303D411|nr:hypothetical protein [Acidovorax sp. GBBC 3334]MDA8457448.1 hypothetical protein [Acidovorax sp. GBBC 3334]
MQKSKLTARFRACALVVATAWATSAGAFQVLPKVSDADRKISKLGSNPVLDYLGHWFVGNGIPIMKSPVHEAITLAAIGCGASLGDESDCVTVEAVKEHRVILYGVRWPDDPPFALSAASPPRIKGCDVKVTLRSTAQPACWWGMFQDAGKQAKTKGAARAPAFGPGDYLLYRSHYGDLQFMHAMGAYDGESAGDTFDRMKMWAKFLWGVASRTTPTGIFIRDLGMDDLAAYFPGDITAMNLFATGIVEVRKDLDKVAIGALLHMVQDSFSKAHVERGPETGATCPGTEFDRPGQIRRFHSYARQSSSLHDKEDTSSSLSLHTLMISPSAVDMSRAFLTMWQQRKSWEETEPLFDCVFQPRDRSATAEAGPYVEVPKPPSGGNDSMTTH